MSATGLLLVDSLWAEKFFIETNRFFLNENNSQGINILQLSDLHLNSVNSQLKRLVKKINQEKPDLILITGDAIDDAKNITLLNSFMGLIDLNIKKVAITGNWEYWGKVDIAQLKSMYQEHNCALLINETRQFTFKNKTISITGIDDYVGGNANIDLAMEGFQKSDVHVVLNHCPEYSDEIANKLFGKTKVDLILSGHTHGGQINLLGFVPFKPQGSGKYLKGWYKDDKKNMYVSKGIGTSILPIRFLSRAEIALFQL